MIGEKYSLEEVSTGRLRLLFTSKSDTFSTTRNLKCIDLLVKNGNIAAKSN